jgi:hypothetical protein
MISKTSEKLAVALEDFLKKIEEHRFTLSRTQLGFICKAEPLSAFRVMQKVETSSHLPKRNTTYHFMRP